MSLSSSNTTTQDIESLSYSEFQIMHALGHGQFGVVYLMKHKRLGLVAVKEFLKDMVQQDSVREIESIAKHGVHANIIRLLAFVHKDEKIIGFAMEIFEESLQDVILCDADYNLELVYNCSRQASLGLSWLHSRGQVHRDVKPLNMLLINGRKVLKLCDFGSARKTQEKMSLGVGTLYYMAPELLKPEEQGPYCNKCDVYSLGIVMWEMYTRSNPYTYTNLSNLQQRVIGGERPPLNNMLDPYLKDIVRKCFEADASDRPSMDDVNIKLNEIGDKSLFSLTLSRPGNTDLEATIQPSHPAHASPPPARNYFQNIVLAASLFCIWTLTKNTAVRSSLSNSGITPFNRKVHTHRLRMTTTKPRQIPQNSVGMTIHQIQLGDLRKLSRVGSGSQGDVDKVAAPIYGIVAYKNLSVKGMELTEKKMREITALLKNCLHPNILSFYTFVQTGDRFVGFLMGYMAGGSLQNVIHGTNGRIDYHEAHYLNWAVQACRGLAFCHLNGLLHRDVKPAKVGTWYYMAPEAMGELGVDSHTYDERCDVYSMAISLWEMARRTVPYPFRNAMNLQAEVQRGTRPSLEGNHGMQEDVLSILTTHWAPVNQRPDMNNMLSELENVCLQRAKTTDLRLAQGNEHMLALALPRA